MAALAAAARADIDLTLPNRSHVAAVLAEPAEVHEYRVVCPAGAVLSVSARTTEGGPSLSLRIRDSGGDEVATGAGTTTVRTRATVAVSGVHVIEVSAGEGATTGAYRLDVAWRSPRLFSDVATLEPGVGGALDFSADPGATATVSVRPTPGSAATPVVESVVRPDGTTRTLSPGRRAGLRLPLAGDYSLRYGAGASAGAVAVRVRVRPPLTPRTSFEVEAAALPPGVEILAARRIGPSGGVVRVGDGPLAGTAVRIPPGALDRPRSVFVGAAPPIVGVRPGTAGGPAVFVGPQGLAAAASRPVTVTIPYDPDAFGSDEETVVVVTRDAAGAVEPVVGARRDETERLVRFSPPHAGAFQAFRPLPLRETQRIDDGPGSVQAALGAAVALSDDLLAAREVDEEDVDLGRPPLPNVAVYRRTGGSFGLETRLYAPDAVANDGFGASISISGNRIVVGANLRRDATGAPSGAAIVFERDPLGTWSPGTEVFAPASGTRAFVGESVVLDGDTLIVGAPRDDADGPTAGAAHVFVRDARTFEWTHEQTLRPAAPSPVGQFGAAVALQDDVAVVGAPTEAAVYVFRRTGTTWTQAARLDAPDVAGNGWFGSSVAIDDGTVAAGVFPRVTDSVGPGGVRVFREDGDSFREVARFTAADVVVPGEPLDLALGTSLALRGDLLIAGAPTASVIRGLPGADPVPGSGNAFVFRRAGGTWRYAARLRGRPDDGSPIGPSHQFGFGVALDGATAVVGSQFDDSTKPAGGALFVFDFLGD